MGKTSFQDLTGKKYNRLEVIELYERGTGKIKWKCRCDCGNVVIAIGNNLKNGHTQSCGCYKRDRTIESHTIHGESDSRLYNILIGMKTRCYDEKCRSYKNYGAKGIRICDEWLGEEGYINFKKWALNNGYNNSLSIDRIDVLKDYCPSNCRWADTDVQANNKSVSRYITINGITKTPAQWEKETGVKSGTLRYRIDKMGMTPEEAISKISTPCNCKYVEYKGKTMTRKELSELLGIKRQTLEYRLKYGVPLDK